jgi:alanine-synthesizing transaminase
MQGGWTVVLRVPREIGEKKFVLAALERGVIVQPGEFYGLPEGRVVLSLLTPPEIWSEGLAKLPVD